MARIYISSTYEDLKNEREAAAQAVRRLNHKPIGMEDYVASDSRPVDKCLDDVRTCDVYVGIFAWRYGHIPDGYYKSITHLEYEEAQRTGKECLIFLLDEEADWSVKKIDKGEKRDKIERLRSELQERHIVSFFKNADQLSSLVSPALSRLLMDNQSSLSHSSSQLKKDKMKDKKTKDKGRDVFISYAFDKGDSTEPGDRQVAEIVCSALESRGIRCWIAPRDILGGAEWIKEVNAALSKARVMVLVFTSSADNSNYVKSEVISAQKRNIPIIPIQIGDVSPGGELEFLLATRQWIYAHMPPQKEELERLIDAVSNYLKEEPKTLEKSKVNEQPEAPGKEIPIPKEMPEDVKKIAEKIGVQKVIINDKGFWEADYGDGIIMVYIPAGEFKMGQTEEEKQWLIDHIRKKDYNENYKKELPLHDVYLDGYWMGKYEVTLGEYKAFISDQGYEGLPSYVSELSPGDDHPIIGVSWEDANAYCKWLSKKKGLDFKLPTEAQWEKAARGTDGRKYPWGNKEPDETLANFGKRIGKTSPVGSYWQGASPYGLLDMAGNVWEWCRDWYDPDYYSKSPERDPQGLDRGTRRVIRGGSWCNIAEILRCAYRNYGIPSILREYLGFRLCHDK